MNNVIKNNNKGQEEKTPIVFDYSKYGFELYSQSECKTRSTYRKYLHKENKESYIEVWDCQGRVTLYRASNDSQHILAADYHCKKIEDLEFLLFNGRASLYFPLTNH